MSDTTRDLKLYAVTRRDLPFGLAAAQLVHASIYHVDALDIYEIERPDTVVLLTVADESELHQLYEDVVTDSPGSVSMFLEPDLNLQATAIAFVSEGGGHLADLPVFLAEFEPITTHDKE